MNLYQQLAENFHRWERRGRGLDLYPALVELEPPFVPFPGHRVNFPVSGQSPEKPNALSRLADKIFRALQPPKPKASVTEDLDFPEELEEPRLLEESGPLAELRLLLPPGLSPSPLEMVSLLAGLSHLSGPPAFELIATAASITVQLTARENDAAIVAAQLKGHFPEMMVRTPDAGLADIWRDGPDHERVVIDFALGREFMYPLAGGSGCDPLPSLVSAMENLEEGEAAVYQVLFTPLSEPWDEEIIPSVSRADGKPFFEGKAALLKGAARKVSSPLFGCVVRLAAQSSSADRMWERLRHMAAPLRLFADREGNHLQPLSNDGYNPEDHCGGPQGKRNKSYAKDDCITDRWKTI